MATQAPKIEQTNDYNKFKLMAGNRHVDYNHVKRLKREIQGNTSLLAANPILVNEHHFVIDGQHRLTAAQELGLQVYYIVQPGLNIDDTRHLNTTQRRWTLMDFAQSFADSGREDYKIFIEYSHKYKGLAGNIIRLALAGGQRSELEQDFRRGNFTIDDIDVATDVLDKLKAVYDRTHVRMNTPMAVAFMKLIAGTTAGEEFDFKLFMSKLEHQSARDLLEPATALRANLRAIENIYNYKNPQPKRLY